MLISVAICTLNRAESLRCTLESLAAMRVADDLDWEIVVVNNNGTDHTDAVIATFADRLPVRREFELQHGLSRARNRAVEAARGDYIVWTDDDVLVDPDWLSAYVDAFRRWPDAAVFGGPIIPKYAVPVATWVIESEALLGGPFAIRNFGDAPLPLCSAEGREPYGANYAVRALEQRAYRYDPDLGVAPGRRRYGEETDVVRRILNAGGRGYWVPRARVEHCIGHDRQTIGFITRHFIAHGETDAFHASAAGDAPPLLFGAARWQWRRLIAGWVGYRIHRLISPAPVWVRYLIVYARARGTIRYSRLHGGRTVIGSTGSNSTTGHGGGVKLPEIAEPGEQ
jgi:glycosyltransferase involved in cell wall biosynthesis